MFINDENNGHVCRTVIAVATGFALLAACDSQRGEAADQQEKSTESEPVVSGETNVADGPNEPTSPLRKAVDGTSKKDESAGSTVSGQSGYKISWTGDEERCSAIVAALPRAQSVSGNDSADKPTSVGYVRHQLEDVLKSEESIEWTVSTEVTDLAKAALFNDGVERRIERRLGVFGGYEIYTLWAQNDAGLDPDQPGNMIRVDFGHSAANTSGLAPIDNAHTKLLYSVFDIVEIGGQHNALVTPVKDIDQTGVVFALKFSQKSTALSPFVAADYYPSVECVFRPRDPVGEEG